MIFVDSSVWFAAANRKDKKRVRAHEILRSDPLLITTDHVLVETWHLLNSRVHRRVAEEFWSEIRSGASYVEHVTPADVEAAWVVGQGFGDQSFSLVDRVRFVVMERLRLNRVASFDNDFIIYRYGRNRDRAFEVLR